MNLTIAQRERMATLDDDVRVVGHDRGCPVIAYPNGRMVKVTEAGRLTRISRTVSRQITDRQLARVEA